MFAAEEGFVLVALLDGGDAGDAVDPAREFPAGVEGQQGDKAGHLEAKVAKDGHRGVHGKCLHSLVR